jgi:hypothetical protein
VQLELDRFAGTHAMLADYYAARRGEGLDESGPAGVKPAPDILRAAGGGEEGEGAGGPLPVPDAEGEDTPAWLAPLCDVVGALYKLESQLTN